MDSNSRSLSGLQKAALSVMGVLMIATFVMTNLQAILWQSSDWLVGAVLPAVVVDLTNSERVQNQNVPLVRSATLDAAAKLKAEHMAKNEYFAHFSPDGVSPWHWFDEVGYTYAHAGENLAIHFTDSAEVVEAWMDSPAHRENIVNGLYTEIGVGTYKGKYEGYDTVYVVQLFGTPAIPAAVPKPVAINIIEENIDEVVIEDSSEIVSETETETVAFDDNVAESAVLSEKVSLEEQKQAVIESDTDLTNDSTEGSHQEVVALNLPALATSSGLAVATSVKSPESVHAGATIATSLATQPHILLQTIYMILGSLVVVMLMVSIVLEARRLHYVQVAYGFLLLFGMGTLWYIHSMLTSGAVVV